MNKNNIDDCLDIGKLQLGISTLQSLVDESSDKAIEKVLPELTCLVQGVMDRLRGDA